MAWDVVGNIAGPAGDDGDAADIAAEVHAAAEKTIPADADEFGITDSASSYVLKRFSWNSLKVALASYYNTLTATLTNKTISGASNTLSDIPQSAVTGLETALAAGLTYSDNIIGTASTKLANGILTMPRSDASRGAYSYDGVADSTLLLTYLYPAEDIDINWCMMFTREAGSGTITLCQTGVYSVDGSGNLTLEAETTSDTSIPTTGWSGHYKTLDSTVSFVKGNAYAFGFLMVGASSVPAFYGVNGLAGEFGEAPRITAKVDSQTSLPSSVAVGSLSDVGIGLYYRAG